MPKTSTDMSDCNNRKSNTARFYMAVAGLSLLGISWLFVLTGLGLRADGAANERVIRVPARGNLQEAIDRAVGGDVIELEAGASYGQVVLPAKNISRHITIRSSRSNELPEGKRISPSDRRLFARIVTRSEGTPAVATAKGAHHYRFVGIEFTSETSNYVYNLVQFGDEKSRADVPRNLEIDRSFIHPGPSGIVRRGLALNSSETVVRNSCMMGFGFPGEETQAVAGWTGTSAVKVLNNYIEGGAENIMFGGSDPASADLIPSDIEIRGNHLKKPSSWKGRASMKTIFELKNAKRVVFAENFLEDNWIGSAMRVTVRNQDGTAPFSTIEDVTIEDNVISGAGDGINILGKDDVHPSATMRNLTIRNNLFLNIDGGRYEGSGYFVQISGGENILIERNTSLNSGNTATFHGPLPRNLVIRDNVIGHGEYGVHGLDDLKAQGARIFSNNAIFNSRRVAPGDLGLAPGSVLVQTISEFGFTDASAGNYTLLPSSRFKGKASGGADLGASIDVQALRNKTVF